MATDVTALVPVTVLTGFLGARKTPLLNRILTTEHGKRVAVIVNEFGEVGIDNQLVIGTDEEIFEMNNGCICFDYMVIQTTGLADPVPFFGLPGGSLVVGSAADLVLVDRDREWVVDSEQFHSKGRNTPFTGWRLRGQVAMTVVGGRVVYQRSTGA